MDCTLEGSGLRTLKSRTEFLHYGFLSGNKVLQKSLEAAVEPYRNSKKLGIFLGNPNKEKTLLRLLDCVPRSATGLIFIDPGGYRRLNWTTLENIALHGKNWQGEKLELLIIFPLEMALMRNLMRPECEASLTRFYGNQGWEDIKRQKKTSKIDPEETKYKLVDLYKTGLRDLGYRFVEDFKPASPTHDPYYHLIFAGDRAGRLKQVKDAWVKPRFLRCELLFGIENRKS